MQDRDYFTGWPATLLGHLYLYLPYREGILEYRSSFHFSLGPYNPGFPSRCARKDITRNLFPS